MCIVITYDVESNDVLIVSQRNKQDFGIYQMLEIYSKN